MLPPPERQFGAGGDQSHGFGAKKKPTCLGQMGRMEPTVGMGSGEHFQADGGHTACGDTEIGGGAMGQINDPAA